MSKRSTAAAEDRRPVRVFIVLAPLFGLLYAFVTPPFQTPDEPQHLNRAFQLSELRVIGRRQGAGSEAKAGGFLPRSLKTAVELALGDIPHNELRHIDRRALEAAWAVRLDAKDREFLEFPTAVLYSPVPYAPQTLAVGIGRLFGARPLVLLYLARLANLAVWVILVGLALKTTPFFRWAFMVLALAPISIAQAASASADAPLNGLAFLFIAGVLRAAWGPEADLSPSRLRVLAALAAAVTLCKPVYGFLPLLAFFIPAKKLRPRRRPALVLASIPLIAWGAAAAWSAATSGVLAPLQSGVDAAAQVRVILARPLGFFGFLVRETGSFFPDFVREFVGQLGWLDVALPAGIIVLFYFALGATAAFDTAPPIKVRWPARAGAAAVVLASAALIVAAIYVVWNPAGTAQIRGVQGRYFIPFGPLIALIIRNRRLPPVLNSSRTIRAALTGVLIFILCVGLAALASRYYAAFY